MSIGHEPLGRRFSEDPTGRNVKRRKTKKSVLSELVVEAFK